MIDSLEKYLLKFFRKILVIGLVSAIFSNSAFAAIWNVDTNSDADNNTCVANEADNDDDCSLRDAITQLATGDTIRFLENMTIVDTSSGITSHQITVDNTTIDGQTNNVTVQIDGNNKGGGSAAAYFKVFGNNTTIKGLYIYNYTGNAIELMYHTATGANINNNVIGLKPDGTIDGNQIGIAANASNATIQNNVVSGNGTGIFINDTSDTDVTIKGNRIGVDGVLSNGVLQSSGGTTDKGNSTGIEIQGGDFTGDGTGDEGLIIGGSNVSDRNVIAGNSMHQIWNRGFNPVTGNITIQNNYIGVGADGSTKLNSGDSSSVNPAGIKGEGTSSTVNYTIKDNVISGMDYNNPLAGFFGNGVDIGTGSSITFQGNKVGVAADGITAVGNEGHGAILDATTVTVGSNLDGSNDSTEGNIFANNGDNGGWLAGDGLQINGADTVTVSINGNKVGVNNTNASAPNSGDGIEINASAATTINVGGVGPTSSSDGTNIIGKNTLTGISVITTGGTGGSPATVNIRNNKVGYDGTSNLGNTQTGISYSASGVSNVTIGTNGDGTNDLAEKNIIGFNSSVGGVNSSRAEVYIATGVKNLVIAGNEIVGSSVAGQGSHGITVNVTDANLSGVTIGGDNCANEANYITGIDGNPLNIVDVGTSSPVIADVNVRCNRIGFTSGNIAGSNNIVSTTDSAVSISEADRILIQDNVIANAIGYGVNILGGNKLEVYGNKFGTTTDGLSPASIGQTALTIRAATLAVAAGISVPVIIGGSTAAMGNVFAASTSGHGININRLAASSTPVTIQGNYIGVCASQSGQGSISTGNLATCKNGLEGIRVDYGAITIGGGSGNNIAVDGTLGAGNVISNNTSDGIYLINNVASAIISGNIIGLIKSSSTANYDVAAGNGGDGITANSAALSSITIGGNDDTNSAGRNVISSNVGDGINITAALAGAGVAVYNNYIGIDWTGTLSRGNSAGDGVEVNSANVNSVNIGSATGRNVISANNVGLNFALVTAAAVINIFNNYIGVSSPGTADLGNTTYGVRFSENVNATINIGGTSANQGNVISGNNQPNAGQAGIYLGTGGASVTNILANKIGTNASGTSAIPNDSGIKIGENVTVNIGNGTAEGSNVISGNTVYGIDVSYGSVSIKGNKIGVNAAGTSALLNGSRAIEANASVNGNIAFLTVGQGIAGGLNTIAGAMRFTNIIPTNEIEVVDSVNDAGVDSDNTWIAGGNYSWQRYVLAVLASSGPPICIDKTDNDGDGFTDYSSDPGCTSVYDSDEYNAAVASSNGGGGSVVAAPAGGAGSSSGSTSSGSASTSGSSGSGSGAEAVVSSGVVSGAESGIGSGSGSGSGVVSPSGTTESRGEASTIPAESVPKAATRIPLSRKQIERVLDDSVSKVTDTVVREKRVNVEALLSLTEERERKKEEPVTVQPVRNYEQKVIDDFLLRDGSVTETEKRVVEQVLEKTVSRELNQLLSNQTISNLTDGGTFAEIEGVRPKVVENMDGTGVSEDIGSDSSIASGVDSSGVFGTDSSGSIVSGVSSNSDGVTSGGIADSGDVSGGGIGDLGSGGNFVVPQKRVLKVVDDDGEEVEIKLQTRIEFELDAEKAKQKRKEVKSKGDDVLVLTTFSDPLRHGVSLAAELNEFGTVGDPLVNDKFAFGVEGGKQYKSRQELIPEKLKVTNLKNEITVGSKFVLWFGAKDVGKKYDVFAVNPETFAYTHLSEIEIDEGNRAVSVIDLDKVSDDVKDGNKLAFLVIQDADGKVIDDLKVNIDSDLQFEGEEIKLSSSKIRDVVNIEDGSRESAFNWTDSLYSNAILSSADIIEKETGKDVVKENDRRVLSGYFEPGSTVFVTWKSLVYSSVVISDASQGYFEVEIPKQLAEGNHEVIVYAYKKNRNVVSQIRNLLFNKKKSS